VDSVATLEFGEFAPDQPDTKISVTGGKNVIPAAIGYTSLKRPVAITDSINERARGAFAARDSLGLVYNYVGDTTKLYALNADISHTDSTRTSGAYATADEEFWEFVKFGDDVYASNFSDYVQRISMGGTNFSDVTAAPQARHIGIINNFLVAGNINESGIITPNKVRWSAINNPDNWTPTTANQSGEQVLYSTAENGGGWIQKVVGGEEGLIMQEYSIWRMQYVGGDLIFQFNELAPGIGTPSRNSVIELGQQIFFLGQDGFYKIVNATTVEPIGESKVDRWFFDNVRDGALDRVIGAADNSRRIVAWLYPDSSATSDTPNKIIFYNWAIGRWSPPTEINAEWLFPSLSVAKNTDDNIATFTDDLDKLVDSRDYSGGELQLGLYDTANKKSSFSGSALTARLDTVEAQLFGGRRSHITGVRPLVEGDVASITASVGYRDNLNNESTSFTTASSPETDTNICHQRVDARYIKARINTSGEFNHLVGAEIFGKPSGSR